MGRSLLCEDHRGRQHPQPRHQPQSAGTGRDRPQHQHLRWPVHCLGGGRVHPQAPALTLAHPLCHPLPRADPAQRAAARGAQLQRRRQRIRRPRGISNLRSGSNYFFRSFWLRSISIILCHINKGEIPAYALSCPSLHSINTHRPSIC